jgi:hypothetical protein
MLFIHNRIRKLLKSRGGAAAAAFFVIAVHLIHKEQHSGSTSKHSTLAA